jgi:hypothetical protein
MRAHEREREREYVRGNYYVGIVGIQRKHDGQQQRVLSTRIFWPVVKFLARLSKCMVA